MSRPFPSRRFPTSQPYVRVNGKIRAREVRVVGDEGQQLGVLSLSDALNLARSKGVDLVEVAANANPPVCRIVDYGKYRYEQSKKDKESKKHQHANKVKEVQLSPGIDPHDFGVKLQHAIDFLCEDMKVKVTLRFRGREMAHQEIGFARIKKFIEEVAPFAQPDSPPRMIGRGINVMLSPLPRNKRAKNPRGEDEGAAEDEEAEEQEEGAAKASSDKTKKPRVPVNAAESGGNFGQNPFSEMDLNGQA